jgi:DNA-binding cell septation regulator SpoVG
MKPAIGSVRFQRASHSQRRRGLEGWVSFILDDHLVVDGLALRLSPTNRYSFSWPARKDTDGRLHHHIRPLNEQSRDAIEGELLAQLFPLIRGGVA